MSDVIKWALLIVGIFLIISLIVVFPFYEYIDIGEFEVLMIQLIDIVGPYFAFAKGLINNFLTPFGRVVLTGLLYWLVGKWAIMTPLKIVVWAYHFIFK